MKMRAELQNAVGLINDLKKRNRIKLQTKGTSYQHTSSENSSKRYRVKKTK